ncbi:MAG: hypothetical protein J3K34DRAFT_519551 [Monoraphidium minutum]|nr:MAG: hypothetical protein J3K34DRAFT_519551 [Monoraphidium minutum]
MPPSVQTAAGAAAKPAAGTKPAGGDGGAPKLGHEKSGRVREKMDTQIGKRVLRITGTIPAVNYLKLPRGKNLGLTGRFCYLQVKLEPPLLFSLHFDLATSDGNAARVSLGNILKDPASAGKRKNGTLSLAVPDATSRWTLLCVDMAAAARAASGCKFVSLRSLQLCSTMSVRGVFTSDIRFGLKSLPREMVLSHALPASGFDELWLPAEPGDVAQAPVLETPVKRSSAYAAAMGIAAAGPPDAAARGPQGDRRPGALSREPSRQSVAGGGAKAAAAGSGRTLAAAAAQVAAGAAAASGEWKGLADPYMQLERINGYTGEFTGTLLWCQATDEVVFAAASLVVAMPAPGGSGARPAGEDDTATAWGCDKGAAVAGDGWGPGGIGGGVGRQRLFVGHTAYVSCLALGGGGRLLASGQEGQQPVVRLWDFATGECLAILCAHAAQLAAVDVSHDGSYLLAVGQDGHARQTMAVWDIGGVSADNPVAPLLAKSVTDYNVRCAAFCPFEPDAFMTAGRDSMRCCRLGRAPAPAAGDGGGGGGGGEEAGGVRGCPRRIRAMSVRRTGGAGPLGAAGAAAGAVIGGTAAPGAASGPNIFTAIAFEAGTAAAQVARRHVFVASAAGTVFQVDYDRCCVVAVFQVHNGAVNALAAEHDAPVSASALSGCGLRLAVGCEDGALGVLDLGAHRYTAAVRSHCGAVNAVVAHPTRPEYATASSDGTARVWDASPAGRHAQLYEFRATGDGAAAALAYHPVRYELVVGYESGALRVFDVATARLAADARPHGAPVAGLAFGPEGARLVSCGADGAVVVCDAARGYQPLRVLPADDPCQRRLPPPPAAAAFSPDGAVLAITAAARRQLRRAELGGASGEGAGASAAAAAAQPPGSCLLLYDADSLEPRLCIETASAGFSRLLFSEDGASLWGLTTCGDVLRFDARAGRLLQRVAAPHRHGCRAAALAAGGRALVTGGADRLVRVWDLTVTAADAPSGGAVDERPPPHQSFVGHPGAVRDVTFLGDELIAAGEGDATTLWRLAPRPRVAGAAGDAGEGPAVAHPDSNVTMRSWLVDDGEHAAPSWRTGVRRAASAAATVAAGAEGGGGGLLVEELQALTVDPGTEPSPLFSAGAPGSPPRAPSPVVAGRAAAGAAPPLAPPNAALVGFGPGAARCVIWARAAGVVIYAPDRLIIMEDLGTRQQMLLQHNSRPIGALALSEDQTLLASAAAEPDDDGGGGGAAEVCVWDLRSRALLRLLRHHGAGVGVLAFSHDGAWLASASAGSGGGGGEELGTSGGGGGDGGSLVLWDLEEGEPAALGKTQGEIKGLAWLPHRALPQLLTAGADGLLLWSLQPEFLEQRALTLPGADPACVAVCTARAAAPSGGAPAPAARAWLDAGAGPLGTWVVDDGGNGDAFAGSTRAARVQEAAHTAFVADVSGGVWRVELGDGRLARCARGAALPPGEGAAVLQWSQSARVLAVGTDQGRVLRYGLGGGGGAAAPGACWQLEGQVMLDGAVEALCLEPEGLSEGLAATAGCTAWYVEMAGGARVPVVCGHTGEVALLQAAPGGDGGGVGPSLVASAASDGLLRVWRVGGGGQAAVPLVEFQSGSPCTAACFASAADGDGGDAAEACSPAAAAAAGPAPSGGGSSDGPASSCMPRLAAGYADGCLRLFDASRHVIVWSVERHPSPVVALAWHPSQPLLLSASRDGAIAVTHADTSRLVAFCRDFTPAVTPLHALAAAPGDAGGARRGGGGLCAAAWLDRFVVFEAPWRTQPGQRAPVVAEFRCPEVPESLPPGAEARLAFLPHNPRLLLFSSPCLGAAALLFDAAAGAPLRQLALPAPVASLAAAHRGGWVALGLEDGSVVVADAEGEASAALCGPIRAVRALAFGARGELVAGAGAGMWVWQEDAARGLRR